MPIVVYLVFLPIQLIRLKNKTPAVLVSVIVALFVVYFSQFDVEAHWQSEFYPTMRWVEDGYRDLMGRKDETTIQTLGSMIHFPPPSNWITGTGVNIFNNPKSNVSSDIGYILQLYYGGCAYFCLLVFPLLILLSECIRTAKGISTQVLFVSIFASVLLANFKGDFFTNNDAFKGITLCALVFLNSRSAFFSEGIRNGIRPVNLWAQTDQGIDSEHRRTQRL